MILSISNDKFKIMLKYNIPKSTLYYLIKNKINEEANIKHNIYQDIYGLNKNEMDIISEYIKPPKVPLTIKSIQNMLNSNLESFVNSKRISYFLKNIWRYTYKKGSSTSIRGASRKIYFQQRIFSWRMLNNILLNRYIVNIDETSF